MVGLSFLDPQHRILFTIFFWPLLFTIIITKDKVMMEKVIYKKRMKPGENYSNKGKG